jgi:hypothetical protein
MIFFPYTQPAIFSCGASHWSSQRLVKKTVSACVPTIKHVISPGQELPSETGYHLSQYYCLWLDSASTAAATTTTTIVVYRAVGLVCLWLLVATRRALSSQFPSLSTVLSLLFKCSPRESRGDEHGVCYNNDQMLPIEWEFGLSWCWW